jgi:haloacid dehalogenase-like hydrolase
MKSIDNIVAAGMPRVAVPVNSRMINKTVSGFGLGWSILILLACCTPKENSVTTKDNESKPEERVYLSSWSDSTKSLIESWVNGAIDKNASTFIPVADRIAVFDNDGTLWPEQPIPNQLTFAIDNLKAMAPTHPEFQKDPALKAVLDGDMAPLMKAGIPGLLKLVNASHNNQTEEEFNKAVQTWIASAKDKKFGKPFNEVIYQPMVELMDYLRANDFKTFIVSGGGADFMRPWTEAAYGIPPYQVIGSYGEVKYDLIDGKPVITKIAGTPFVDDKAGKPMAIHRFIGKVPVFCAGNSDGDQAMLEYTTGSKYKSFGLLLHHTDSLREYKYALKTLSGHLESALVEAKEKNWLVVDMKKDFKKIFAFE